MNPALEILHIVAAFFAAIGAIDFFYEMFRIFYRLKRRKKPSAPKETVRPSEISPEPPERTVTAGDQNNFL